MKVNTVYESKHWSSQFILFIMLLPYNNEIEKKKKKGNSYV